MATVSLHSIAFATAAMTKAFSFELIELNGATIFGVSPLEPESTLS
jgi:hypothetical protein